MAASYTTSAIEKHWVFVAIHLVFLYTDNQNDNQTRFVVENGRLLTQTAGCQGITTYYGDNAVTRVNSTRISAKINPVVMTTAKRTDAMIDKIVALGVPRALADSFPLTPHTATKRWCKKLPTPHGPKIFYFGSLSDWKAALDRYEAEKNDLVNGRTPSSRTQAGLPLKELLNRFLHFKRSLVDSGELTMRSWDDYHRCGERLLSVFGKNKIVETLCPEDFERLRADYAKGWKAVRTGNEINRARIIFRYAFTQALVKAPVQFGASFKRPSRKTLRTARAKDRQQHGARMFTREELHTILSAAPQPMRSMVLLACNGGLSNMDVSALPTSAIDFQTGILDFPRGKTGVPRIIPLWAETIASIREWQALRPAAKDPADDHLLFLTKQRSPWHRNGRFVEDAGTTKVKGLNSLVSINFRYLLDKLGMPKHRNFLALRHGFRTVARGARDREAIDALMGHTDESMAGHYIEDGLPVERLRAVTEFVRAWLYGTEGGAK